jgi:predicted CXXCH cytochrome family protein
VSRRGTLWASVAMTLAFARMSMAQTTPPVPADTLGMHNLTAASGSSVTTQGSLGCTFCHAPHSGIGGVTPLWNQTLSLQSYTPYTSTTYKQQGASQMVMGKASSLCLSCHDGTVAVGQTAAYGKIPVNGSLNNQDVLGTNLMGSHPFSLVLPIKDAPDLAASLVAQGVTADPKQAVTLVNGNVECTSCHNPHAQAIDPVAQNFLVRDSSNGQMCLACHDPNRIVQGQVNLLSGYTGSIHAVATNQVASGANVGLYTTVAANSCTSCHMEHNAGGPARLMRPATPATPGVDANTLDCVTCHNGGGNISPAAPNVYAEFEKTGPHLLPAGLNVHDEAEPAVLNNNRHATCVDCHNAHATNPLTVFTVPPGIRPPQTNVTGVSAVDGTTVVAPAVNQYETCLRCHGTSVGKQVLPLKYGYLPTRLVFSGDQLNLVPQFSATATSSHPVTHDSNSPLPQPSLLTDMVNENGMPSGRLMGTRIFCTDCHNSDDNREFGGTGPNGPHGSIYPHILERNYVMTQAVTPGGTVTTTYPNPDLSPQGPYAMCAKCHNLSVVAPPSGGAATSWSLHTRHISQDGFSCSVCHTAHGMGAVNGTISGNSLVNFDIGVVAQNATTSISYNAATNRCTLVCHTAVHNADGSVTVNGTVVPQVLTSPKK